MKRQYFEVLFISILVLLSLAGCSGNKSDKKKEAVQPKEIKNPVIVGNETSLLLKDLKENGNYVNSQVFPSLIKASIVNESLNKNILVIDLRTSKLYSEGHIKGSVNKKFE
jgi:hypothetical protein